MKYAIMSDVHANPAALEKALKDSRAVGCEKFILLGDITGYGYDPKRALELVRENFDVVLMGNHDSACLGLEPEWEVEGNINYDLDRKAHEQLSESELEWLRERRYLHAGDRFIVSMLLRRLILMSVENRPIGRKYCVRDRSSWIRQVGCLSAV